MQVTEQDGIYRIELPARVDVASSPELETLCNSLLDGGHPQLICDFSSTEYVSSIGLRVFLSTLKRTVKVGGKLVLCRLKPGIMEIFDMTGLTGLFSIFDSLEAALASFPAASSPQTEPSPPPEVKEIISPTKHTDIEEIVFEKPPQEVTRAYVTIPQKVQMDEKA